MVATPTRLPRSFEPDDRRTTVGPAGEVVHERLLAHTDRLRQCLYEVTDGVWCMVGNGLSNQTFVLGPEGLIVIDTGESIEEMQESLEAVRRLTEAPVVAVIYTHFHYCNGTAALVTDAGHDLPIWGHEKIESNLRRMAVEMSTALVRGVVQQFALVLPDDGPDGVVNVGLGLHYHEARHAPFTPGFVPPTSTVGGPTTATIAGLRVELRPAPSDADDNITVWFPDLGLCVNNLVWPALFNVFAIRGEEYRDPRVLLRGIDEILGFEPEYLVGAHGPPIVGRDLIQRDVTDYRDAIQFLWDQTVRGINRGLTFGELIEFVQLPDRFERCYLTQQHYGLVEHHVRQIHTGLVGWFDGDESTLFPLPTAERARRLIAGFGGPEAVRDQTRSAIDDDDLRWALELATWLVRSETGPDRRADAGTPDDRALLAEVLRAVARRTTAANIRNWCLTRARELDGTVDLSGFRRTRFGRATVLTAPPEAFVHGLRVLLDPARAADLDEEVAWRFVDGSTVGLRVRHGVAVPTDGSAAALAIELDPTTWASVLAGDETVGGAIDAGSIEVVGNRERVERFFACFELPGHS